MQPTAQAVGQDASRGCVKNNGPSSSEGAQEYSPRRKPWVRTSEKPAPEGRKTPVPYIRQPLSRDVNPIPVSGIFLSIGKNYTNASTLMMKPGACSWERGVNTHSHLLQIFSNLYI